MSEPTQSVDPFIQSLIRRKAAKLVRSGAIPRGEREDIEQDLLLDLLRRLPNYDSQKSDHADFVRAIVNHAVTDLMRTLLAAKRGRGRTTTLESQLLADSVLGREDEELLRADLVLDIQEFLRQLPLELRRVAEELQSQTLADVARTLGISRETVYARLREIRQACERSSLRKYLHTSPDTS